jgi:hypothetical protein
MFTPSQIREAHRLARLMRSALPSYRMAYAAACRVVAARRDAEARRAAAAVDFIDLTDPRAVAAELAAPVAITEPTPRRWFAAAAAAVATLAAFAAPLAAFAAPLIH